MVRRVLQMPLGNSIKITRGKQKYRLPLIGFAIIVHFAPVTEKTKVTMDEEVICV